MVKIVIAPDSHQGGVDPLKEFVMKIAMQHERTVICFESWSNERPFFDAMPNITQTQFDEFVGKARPDVRDYYGRLVDLIVRFSEIGIKTVPIDANNSDGSVTNKLNVRRELLKVLYNTQSFDEYFGALIPEERILGELCAVREPQMRDNVLGVAKSVDDNTCIIVIVGGAHVPFLQKAFEKEGYKVELSKPLGTRTLQGLEATRLAMQKTRTDAEDAFVYGQSRTSRPPNIETMAEARAHFETERKQTSQLRTEAQPRANDISKAVS